MNGIQCMVIPIFLGTVELLAILTRKLLGNAGGRYGEETLSFSNRESVSALSFPPVLFKRGSINGDGPLSSLLKTRWNDNSGFYAWQMDPFSY